MKFNKRGFIILFITVTIFCTVYLCFGLIGKKQTSPLPEADNSKSNSPIYVMKSYGDIIGIYNYGEDMPIKLVNVTVKKLPEKDAKSLDKGIEIFTNEQLNELLEDFDQ